ncbi:23S rRNA pseudouridine1911/1915/1917 synthase [Hydrogenispora ethanolica]|jgi:23S rRNA pseudouridine1911/1915/1917 synthase|uniref:Pseudouridine synthase n=1 Tax=Hydrogenispora ethanolica TaxID=1082276 RepID=A0A4R1QZ79_HYDET|nr:RluA family pseudouridine synthase [Hydrogenispora ethanolica]TCL58293.1 23S rRNA pseudouridine1911/1915/1917 synthase [Hydrogenispora ethanolica]
MSTTVPPLTREIPFCWTGKTVESYLKTTLRLSRGFIRSLKRTNGIFINGIPVKTSYRFLGGEQLCIVLTPRSQTIQPEILPLEVIYEDPDVIVVNKPAGQLVHPVRNQKTGTLANALVGYWLSLNETASFHPIHRLDKTTSGLVLVAKSSWAHQQLASQLENDRLHRLYLAVCSGRPTRKSALITLPVQETKYVMKRQIAANGKTARTVWRVLRIYPSGALMAVKLHSGRTHQIRVHLSHIGLPLRGDALYGRPDPKIDRPALHAVRLRFIHPRTGDRIKLTAPIPRDFLSLI